MTYEIPKCRVTVLKRTLQQDLVDEYLEESLAETFDVCQRWTEGQEMVIDPTTLPEGFCPWAWAAIRHTIMRVASGGETPGMRRKGVAIAGCSDWFRPVIFKIERLDSRVARREAIHPRQGDDA